MLLLVIIGVLMQDSPKIYLMKEVEKLEVGGDYYIGVDGKKLDTKNPGSAIGITSILWVDELIKSVRAKDDLGFKQMIQRNKIMELKHGTKVKFLKSSKVPFEQMIVYEVRILDGESKGQAVLVLSGTIVELIDEAKVKQEAIEQEKMRRQKQTQQLQALKEAALKKAREAEEASVKAEAAAEAAKEQKAAELLKSAKRWLKEENNKEIALQRLDELLTRFPKAKVAPEAKKLQAEIEKKK